MNRIMRRYYFKYSDSKELKYIDVTCDTSNEIIFWITDYNRAEVMRMAYVIFYIEDNRKIYFKNRDGIKEEIISNEEKTLIHLKSKECEF